VNASPAKRIGMVVPSLNTIGEDDLRRFCPPDVAYHVHRIRLRKEGGVVTLESLLRAYLEAIDESSLLKDLGPDAVTFNCTGASVAYGPQGDQALAERMQAALGVPSSNTMVAIKRALAHVGARKIVHVCPFADKFSSGERESLEGAGLEVIKSVGLNFVDAREAARMDPETLSQHALGYAVPGMDALLLSCANVRAFETVEHLEHKLGVPVITSNQAVLWDALRLAGWQGTVAHGRLFA
jgi:maleate isomerase